MAATKIESNKVNINATQEVVYTFLTDFNNIKSLLPQDKISDWNATVDQCSFKIQNAAIIPLVKESVEPHNKINIKSGDKAPFPFTLVVHINAIDGSEGCEAYMNFDGEINAFLKMMVVKPLTNLFNYMAKRMQEVHA